MTQSLKNRILNYLKKNPGYLHKGRIEELAKSAGFLGDNAGRRCRELVNEGLLERKEERGSVMYRFHDIINSNETKISKNKIVDINESRPNILKMDSRPRQTLLFL